ncbi:hypothetical protein GS504_15840 [Rhodococcus hoagii]|nr:hypothetical protein [Prescottella equi]NKR94289.1 hypothetical protein [Prescottella equi]NKS58926.1 hypothetical protein [Prescottella equi]NKS71557.1 hypothetical protein [Prescottella equi]
MSAFALYGFSTYDPNVYDERHALLCTGRNCRTCDAVDRVADGGRP